MSAADGRNNEGHGLVYERPDSMVARCGGPGICEDCTADQARKDAETRQAATGVTAIGSEQYVEFVTTRVTGGRVGNYADPGVLIGKRHPLMTWLNTPTIGVIVGARVEGQSLVLRVGALVAVTKPDDVIDFGNGNGGFGKGTKYAPADW